MLSHSHAAWPLPVCAPVCAGTALHAPRVCCACCSHGTAVQLARDRPLMKARGRAAVDAARQQALAADAARQQALAVAAKAVSPGHDRSSPTNDR